MKRIVEETVSFCSEFFLVTETVTDISGSQFLKKDYISTNANCFCGWWKTFSFIFLDSSQLLPVKAIFPSNRSYFLVNRHSSQWKRVFCLQESQFLKTNHTPAVETYFPISFTRLVQTDFLLSGKSIFLVRAILLLVESIIGIRSKQFSKKELNLAKNN